MSASTPFIAVKGQWRPGMRTFRSAPGTRLFLVNRHISPSPARAFSGRNLHPGNGRCHRRRQLQTLAIETSCDDTSVAVLRVSNDGKGERLKTEVPFHEKVTAPSESYGGIHPLVALHSHQRELGLLVETAVERLNSNPPKFEVTRSLTMDETSSTDTLGKREGGAVWRPDFVTVTRGPGMRSNLSVGLDTAKGLAIAWGVPLVGVHHMQAHALTSRLCSTLEHGGRKPLVTNPQIARAEPRTWTPHEIEPHFPFLSVLASGGHTILIKSTDLTEHKILAESTDIAIGDCLDKSARVIVPEADCVVPYGRALERFAFPDSTYDYTPPARRQDELERRPTEWGWSFNPPLATSGGREKTSLRMQYSFSGLVTSVERIMTRKGTAGGQTSQERRDSSEISIAERRAMAREMQRLAFEHVTSRILIYLNQPSQSDEIKTIVVSGGVASNAFFRHVLRSTLDTRGYGHIALSFPPVELCTDNALMIAWAGMEMFDAGWRSELGVQPVRKWSMDAGAEDGGILGIGGWVNLQRGL